MSEWNSEHIIEVILEAGALALQHFQKVSITLKPDASLVTEADVAVESLIRSKLERSEDQVYLLGEESVDGMYDGDMESYFKGSTYIVDPIDGTTNYANGLEMWGVSIGFMEAGSLTHGAIYFPVLRELFVTCGDEVHHYDIAHGRALHKSVLQPPKRMPTEMGIVSLTQRLVKRATMGGAATLHLCGAAVYGIKNVLLGRNIAYLGKLKLWDVAAGLPMLYRLGLEAQLMNGTRVQERVDPDVFRLDLSHQHPFSMTDIIVLSHADDHEKVVEDLNIEWH